MPQLAPPDNLVKFDWQTIAWDSVVDAVSYDIYFDAVYHDSVTDPTVSLQWAAGDVPATGVEITVVAIAGGGDTDSDPSTALTWARDVWADPGDEEQIDNNTLRMGAWGGGTLYPDIEVRIDTVDVATITDYGVTSYFYDFSPAPENGDSVDYRFVNGGHDPSNYSAAITWVINQVTTLGGSNTGTVVKDAAATTTGGTLTITDNDPGESSYQATSGTGTYGTFTLATTGVWIYTINNSDTDTQALTTGQITSDVFVATSNDGSASQNVTITVRESASATTNLAVFRYLLEVR